jgi:hypothetical protein
LKSINLHSWSGTKKNSLTSEKNQLSYLFTTRLIKMTSNYWCISLLSLSYKILSNILLSRLTPYTDKIIRDHQRRFWCKRSMADHIFIRHWRKNRSITVKYISYLQISRSLRVEYPGN